MKNTYYFLTRHFGLLLLIGALSVALSTNAQPPVIQWQRILEPVNPGGANGRTAIIKNSQGGYSSVTADQRLVSLTISGDVISDTPITDINGIGATNRVLSALSPVLTSDGAIVIGILSQTEGWKLQKRNVSGEIIWTSGVPFSQSSNFQYQVSSVVSSLDGGYFVFATRYDNTYADPFTPIATYVKISHYSSTGYFLGDQDLRYSTITNNLVYYNGTRVNKVIKTPDGGFLAVGTANPTSSNSTLRGWAAKLNAQGTVVWQNRYESMNTIDDAAVSSTGSYLLSGSAISTPSGLFSSSTLRVDASGSQGNNTPILVPYPAFNSLSSIAITPSGYIIGNDTSPNINNGDIRLTSFSEQGAILWTKTIGGSGRDFNFTPSIVVTNDGYIVAGQTASTDGDVKGKQTNNVATWIVKLQNPNNILTLAQPTYNCQTGAFTFNTTGGDGAPITYFAPGITGPTTNPNQFVDRELRQAADAQPLSLSATQSGVTATYVFDLRATCPIGTNPPVQPHPDRAALVDLFNSTNGPGWTNKTNWLQGDSPCNWFGVTCDGSGRVIKLNMVNNNMTGVLPASLGNLSQLQSLVIFQNPITGSLPASLGNLRELTSLNIEYTQISGEIPASLGNLSKLTSLFLAQNQLSGSIPASLGKLTQLENLYLFGNSLTKCIPAELASLCGKDVRLASAAMPDSYFTTFCSNGTGACTTTPTTGLALIAPTYDCGTGAFTFNTIGGNGTLIEYQAPGITGWTTNPNQFVDRESRTANDVQPFTLMARQSGTVVTYTWNLKQACGRARLAFDEVGTTVSLRVLGNPAREQVRVLITGAEGQAVQLRLTDLQGRLLESRTVEQAAAAEEQLFRLDQTGPHMLLLQATKQQQVRTVKIIRQ